MEPSGIWYCRVHHGIKNEDDNGTCDMSFGDDVCDRWVELLVPPENVIIDRLNTLDLATNTLFNRFNLHCDICGKVES